MKPYKSLYLFIFSCLPCVTFAQQPQLTVFVSGVEFTIVRCYGESSTNKATIEFVVKNTNEFTKEVRTGGTPKAFDEFGSEVVVINKTGGWLHLFGGDSRMAALSERIPVKGKVLLSQVSKSSQFISALQFETRGIERRAKTRTSLGKV